MKIVITESQLKLIISEQIPGLGPAGGYDYQKPAAVQAAGKIAYDALVNMDPHTRNQILEIGAAFIPFVGPALSAGIASYDAWLYHKEGKNKEAAVALVLGLLPGIASVANKIPGIKTLGQKGMNVLADKVAKGVTQLTKTESEVLNAISLNKNMVHAETDGLLKRAATKITNQTGKYNPTVHAVAKVGDTAIKAGVNKAVAAGVRTGYDLTNR